MFSYRLQHMDTPVLADQQKLTFISSVWTLDALLSTFQWQWSIGMGGKRELRESVLLACLHDFDDEGSDCILSSVVHCFVAACKQKIMVQNTQKYRIKQ